jgi:protein-S-isoprenylcysteine O-methyltransferase Ste14
MALSKAEQELLAQLESSLAAEDPKLAQKLASVPAVRRIHPRRATLGVVGALLGVVLLVAGMMIGGAAGIAAAVAGFVVMLGATVFFLTAWQAKAEPGAAARRPRTPPPAAPPDFMARLEQRWRERQDRS